MKKPNATPLFKKAMISLIAMLFCFDTYAQTLYVDHTATGTNNGSSWANAYTSLGDALDSAQHNPAIEDVLIAQGTYVPNHYYYEMNLAQIGAERSLVSLGNNVRHQTFHVRGGLRVFGGYPNGGGVRNVVLNPTILSGALNATDSVYHVVFTEQNNYWLATHPNDTTLLDGLKIHYGRGITNTININTGNQTYALNASQGAGIYHLIGGNFQTNNCIIEQNKNLGNGAGLFIGLSPIGIISNCIINNNTSNSSGGGIFSRGKITLLVNNSITNNKGHSNYGGGGFLSCDSAFIQNNIINNNACTASGGLDVNYNYIAKVIKNSFAYNVTTSSTGGAMAIGCNDTNHISVLVDSNTFINNISTAGGGIEFFYSVNAIISNNIFTSNNASGFGGGAIYKSSNCGAFTYINNTFVDNNASNNGGSIYSLQGPDSFVNNNFSFDSAQIGGAIYFSHSGDKFLNNNTFANCHGYFCAAIDARQGGNLKVLNNTFNFNKSNISIIRYNPGITRVFKNNIFYGNKSNLGGNSLNGSTLYNIGDISYTLPDTIENNSFDKDTASSIILLKEFTKVYVNKNIFNNNNGKVLHSLNGIYSSNNKIINNVFYNNKGTGDMIDNERIINADTIINNVFANNTYSINVSGSSLIKLNGVKLFANNTLYKNQTNSLIFLPSNNTASINNNIMHRNGSGAFITTDFVGGTASSINFYNNLFGDSSTYNSLYPGDPSWIKAGNLFKQNAKFIDTTNLLGTDNIWETQDDGLKLGVTSPCVNTGANFGLPANYTTDIVGSMRIQDVTIDMGAYESNSTEIPCNGIDDNMNGLIDENSPPTITYYLDADADGYGNINFPNSSCTGVPIGYVLNNTDCNDQNANIYPTAPEIACNNIDDDCDGMVDENSFFLTFYQDLDGDTYGNINSPISGCNSAPIGYTSNNTDCNDGNASIYPGSTEIAANNIDDDCDGLIDEVTCNISLITTETNPICNGTNGSLTFNATGGTGSITYKVNTVTQTSPFSTVAGIYTIVATDANNCAASSVSTITQPSAIALTATSINALCNGLSGSFNFSAIGGTGTITYKVNNVTQTSPSYRTVGVYTIVATDANGCSTSTVNTITQPNAVSLTSSATNALCNGGNGSFTFSATGGSGTITYQVNSTTVTSPSAQIAGVYAITATDANGCNTNTVKTITQPPAIVLTSSSINALCNGGNGSLTFSATGGTGALTYKVNTVTQTSPFSTVAGTYTIVATDANNCLASSISTITQPSAIALTATSTNAPCNGGNGSLNYIATGGTGAIYYVVNGVAAVSPSIKAVGIYTIRAIDANACSITTLQTISQPNVLTLVASKADALCNGSNGSLTFNATGGTIPISYSVNGTAATSPSAQPASTTYTIIATDVNGCTSFQFRNITQPTSLQLSGNIVNATCNGNNGILTYTANGGTGAVTYTINGLTSTSPTIKPAGSYSIIATDANGCATNTVFTITQPLPITITASSINPLCAFGQGTLIYSGTGGTGTVSGYVNGGFEPSPAQRAAGVYTVTLQDAFSCSVTTILTITQPTSVILTASASNAVCNGGNGSLTFSATGGTGAFTYKVNNILTTSPSIKPVGNYTINATDANGCVAGNVYTITQPDLVSIANISWVGPTCFGGNGSLSYTAQGGTGILTTFVNNVVSTSPTLIPSGSFTISAVDINNCTGSIITSGGGGPLMPTITTTVTPAPCKGGNGSLSIGITGFSTATALVNGQPHGNNFQSFWPAGNYTVVATSTLGCSISSAFIITEPATTVVLSSSITQPLCTGANGSLAFSATGGTGAITYKVNGITRTSPFTIPPGNNFTIAATDANNCSMTTLLTSIQPASISLTASASNALCNGENGTLTFNASGGIGAFTYKINTITQTSPYSTAAGTYTILANDANNCTKTLVQTITQPVLVNFTASATNAYCNGGNGSLAFNATSGTGPLTYIVNGFSQSSPYATTAGIYTILATDVNSCTASSVSTITQPTAIALITSSTNTLCNGTNGSLVFSATGGTGAITYKVNTVAQTSPFSTAAGTYTIIATDVYACSTSTVTSIIQPTAISLFSSVTNVPCNNNNGSLSFNATGGTGTISYKVNNVSQTSPFSAAAGTYTILATDANNCTASQTLTVNSFNGLFTTYYQDNDGDTYGNLNNSISSCNGAPSGYVSNSTDCDDNNASINPAATEIACNNIDDDCDGTIDENSVFVTYYQDADGDTYGNLNNSISSCNGAPSGYISNSTDCNDQNLNVYPGATEIPCNNIDDDCNGTIDENSVFVTYYQDFDGDTYGNLNNSISSCNGAPSGYVSNSTDCNDQNVNVYPGAAEIACNNVDDDCDGTIDENSVFVTYYLDDDGDGYGNPNISLSSCNGAPINYVLDNTDCNDGKSNINPGQIEIPNNGKDDDCDGQIDETNCALTLSATINNITCNNKNNGTIQMTTTAGIAPYTYTSNPTLVQTSAGTYSNVSPNNYTITVIDNQGCTTSTTVTITQPAPLLFGSPIVTIPTCNGSSNGTINISTIGGNTPVSYTIHPNNGAQSTNGMFTNLSTKIYLVKAIDANGCTTSKVIALPQPAVISFAKITKTNIDCHGKNTGAISVDLNGGTGFKSITTLPQVGINNTPTSIQQLGAGNYIVQAKDANNCTRTTSVILTQANPITFSSPITQITTPSNGKIIVSAIGGIGSKIFSINPNAGIQSPVGTFSGLNSGVYVVTATDVKTCTATTQITLTPIVIVNQEEENIITNQKVNIYPNPIDHEATIDFDAIANGNATIIVLNMRDEKVKIVQTVINKGNNKIIIDIKDLAPANYILQLITNNAQTSSLIQKR